jgi:hypothetical protein
VDSNLFDQVSKRVGASGNRRAAIRILMGSAVALLADRGPATAKDKDKDKDKNNNNRCSNLRRKCGGGDKCCGNLGCAVNGCFGSERRCCRARNQPCSAACDCCKVEDYCINGRCQPDYNLLTRLRFPWCADEQEPRRVSNDWRDHFAPLGFALDFTRPFDQATTGLPGGSAGVKYTTVVAPISGSVVKHPNSDTSYGNYVEINPGFAWKVILAHLDRIAPSLGSSVAAGDVVGIVGSTGLSNSAEHHIHFELRLNNKRPERLFSENLDLFAGGFKRDHFRDDISRALTTTHSCTCRELREACTSGNQCCNATRAICTQDDCYTGNVCCMPTGAPCVSGRDCDCCDDDRCVNFVCTNPTNRTVSGSSVTEQSTKLAEDHQATPKSGASRERRRDRRRK